MVHDPGRRARSKQGGRAPSSSLGEETTQQRDGQLKSRRLTYLSRGLGVRATLMTLTRGEGGQNAMSADIDDALGVIRTNELLKADEFYGAGQLWGTEADFGFSKTQEESYARWGHDRVLYDADRKSTR